MAVCPDCPGGSNPTFEINPNFAQLNVVLSDDNRVILPRPLRPENICINALSNVDVDADTPVSADVRPMYWNADTCTFERGQWPCHEVTDWDRTLASAPDDPCVDCATDGVTRLAREVTTGCISHICLGGQWVCVGGPLSDPGPVVDFICYDVSSWTFPAFYSAGSPEGSQWQVFGSDVMDVAQFECSDGFTEFVNAEVEFACWGDPGFYLNPSQGGLDDWNDLPWATDTISPGSPLSILATGDPGGSHGCARPAFRIDPAFPVGAAGPIRWTFNMLQISGNTSFAAVDIVTGRLLPIDSFTQPAGPTQGTVSGNVDYLPSDPRDTILQTLAGPTGTYSIDFALPSGAQAENVRFLAWNMGGINNTAEEFSALTNEITVPNSTCCYEWASIAQLSTWLNQNDPNGLSWIIDGTCICAEAPQGLGAQYGDLASCADSSPAIITQDEPGCP